ncbi:MAG: helix-turn-helix domain-containing protein [Candidatus Gastranaerophilales bacterium]|nr:helix-turn-helix domain-containing protein [Candidatus Gastranaerophilales bacterium]MCM1072234.1 helix-turn-helix domain-containing protein [Bacteroides sp.]
MEKKDLYKIIGKNIQTERQKQGLTQETFAELMDVSWSYVSKIESGILNLSLGKVWEIAKFLQIDVDVLLKINRK